jgi:hypothetical protein
VVVASFGTLTSVEGRRGHGCVKYSASMLTRCRMHLWESNLYMQESLKDDDRRKMIT